MQKGFKIYLSFIMSIISVLILGGCGSEAAGNMNGVTVKVAAADKNKLQTTVDVTGILVPAQTVNVSSKISGQVMSLGSDVGNSVKSGDTLITLETKTLNVQLQQAEAALQQAQAAAQSAKNQVDQAKINLDSAQKDYDRNKALFDSQAISQSTLDGYTSKLEIAQKQYELASGPAQAQAQAAINTAEANINNINVQLENATITSPINGVVTNRNINPGEVASPGVSLLTIADTSVLKLKGTISQDAVPLLKTGQDIDVSIDVYPGKVFKGQISNIGPVAVSTGKYFPIEISINNTGDIKAGLSAHVSIGLTSEEGIVVPASAVVQNNGQSYVFVIKDKVASKRNVEIGLTSDTEIEILKGLDAGEQVATTNLNSLFDKMPVSVN